MVYSGTMHCICAVVACITVPGSVVILQHTWQVVTLLLTGNVLLRFLTGAPCLSTPLMLSACLPASCLCVMGLQCDGAREVLSGKTVLLTGKALFTQLLSLTVNLCTSLSWLCALLVYNCA